MAEWIQRDLAKIGIRMKLRTYEWITYIGYWIKGMDDASNKVGSQQMSWGMTIGLLDRHRHQLVRTSRRRAAPARTAATTPAPTRC